MANVDVLIKKHIDEQTQLFIDSIDPAVVCAVASSHNNGAKCTLASEPMRGSFKICYPVTFEPGEDGLIGQKWNVRIPLVPRVALVDEKLESEVAVMTFVKQKTTIPIPRVHGYATQSRSKVGFAYIVIDFVEGDTLFRVGLNSLDESQRLHFYNQLADIFIQLRLHEFPCIGSLAIPTDTPEGTLPEGISIRRPLSIDLNEQEIEGLQPGLISRADDTYASTVDYIHTQMQLVQNWFFKGRNSVANEFDAEIAMYDFYQFQARAVEWVDPVYNHGPFILMHGDLRPTNIIVDKDMNIVSIIDWEWSRIVPAQLFVPPTWLTGKELCGIRPYFAQKDYVAELVKLRDIVAIRESQLPTTLSGPPLSKIWSGLELEYSFLIAAGLLFLTTISTTYQSLDHCYHGRSIHHHDRAKAFVQAKWQLRRLVKIKVADRAAYLEDLQKHGIAPDSDLRESLPPNSPVSGLEEECLPTQSHLLPSADDISKFMHSHLRVTSCAALFVATCIIGTSLFRRTT